MKAQLRNTDDEVEGYKKDLPDHTTLVYFKGRAFVLEKHNTYIDDEIGWASIFRLVTSPIHVFKLDPKP